jgi:hypothetical protein
MSESVIETIKKLLRMKHGGTQAEIETALLLAQKLAAKHNLDLNKINPDEAKREPITHDVSRAHRIQWECKYAALIIDTFFNVRALTSCEGIIFIGTKTDLEIAMYTYNYLIQIFRLTWKMKRGRVRNRQIFLYGIYAGLFEKLRKQQPKPEEQEGLILVSHALRLEEYVKNFGPHESKSIKPDGNVSAAFSQGYRHGESIEIRKGINTNKSTKLLQ